MTNAPVSPRVVLITGGSRGIGLACARHFAALGDHVAVTYNSSPPPSEFFAVKCDVTNNDDVDNAFKAIEEQFGPVQVLVSNAGITRDGLLLRMGEDDFASVIDANLTAAYRVCKRATQGMLRARSGRIILMSSVVALLVKRIILQVKRVSLASHVHWPANWVHVPSPSTLSHLVRSIPI